MIDEFKIYKQFNVPQNILMHLRKTSEVGEHIANMMNKKGLKVNVETVKYACLLHDIDKIQTLDNHAMHGIIASKKIKKMGFSKIADAIRKHPLERIDELKTIEEKIVFYSDKIVEQNTICNLLERERGIIERYSKTNEDTKKIHELFLKVKKIEEEIFSKLDIKPNEFYEMHTNVYG